MDKYIWQDSNWPDFRWDSERLLVLLGEVRKRQGALLAKAENAGLELQAGVLVEDAQKTSEIEGEVLDVSSLRSSVARRIGLPSAGLPVPNREVDGLVELLMDATYFHDKPLTHSRLKGWQAALFPTGYSGVHQINAGQYRTGAEPMYVVSGPIGKEQVHYEAPPSDCVPAEMSVFLEWWKKTSPKTMDGLIRAGVAHFWFVTIHPFDDGNGRIARAITDMALAADDGRQGRVYSMSSQIAAERAEYYEILKCTQHESVDITEWLEWFLHCLRRAFERFDDRFESAMFNSRFWQSLSAVVLNNRQKKVIEKLLAAGPGGFTGDLTNRKYVGMTKTTRETAKRDLADMVEKGILVQNPGKGRSISYRLNWERESDGD